MKYVLLIIDGVSDEAIEELGYCTPLEKAVMPNIDYVAYNGQVGRIDTAFKGYPVESMVCIMGLLGYDARKYYPCGRASVEAIAQGIDIGKDDLAFRCNIITTDKEKKYINDFTANLISDSEAKRFISEIKLPRKDIEIYHGQSYRNILVVRNSKVKADDIRCYAPHMHIGEDINKLSIFSNNNPEMAKMLNDFIMSTHNLKNNEMLWLWSPSRKIEIPKFKEITGLSGAVVCGMDFLRGIAIAADMDYEFIDGTNGYIDTDYSAKANCAIKYIENHDFVLVHVNATDEEAHQHNYNGKIKAIENVDKLVLGPILKELKNKYKDEYRIAICGDHMTRCRDGKHVGEPVPFAIHGSEIHIKPNKGFNEKSVEKCNPIKSTDFISTFFNKNE